MRRSLTRHGATLGPLTVSASRRAQEIIGQHGGTSDLKFSPDVRRRSTVPIAIGVVLCLASGVALYAWRGSGARVVVRSLSEPAATGAPSSAVEGISVAQQEAESEVRSPSEIARDFVSSTVSLRCKDSLGTGFYITERLILTNAHVLCRDTDGIEVVASDGTVHPGRVVHSDVRLDVAVVRAMGTTGRPVVLGDATSVAQGDDLVVIGNPHGMDFTVSQGIASYIGRAFYGVAYLQIDASVNPGNSGGPVFDDAGRVVGIVSMKHGQAEGVGLALPINYVYEATWGVSPPGDVDGESWIQLRRRSERDDRDLGRQAAAKLRAPILVSATTHRSTIRNFTFVRPVIARISDERPDNDAFDFEARTADDGRLVCKFEAVVRSWHPMPREELPQERLQAWAESHAIPMSAFAAQAVPTTGCRQGVGDVVLTMENASELSKRVEFRL